MTRTRLAVVYGVVAVLIGGHAFDILRDREHWPFSNYPMFAELGGYVMNSYRFTALTVDPATGSTREVDFDPDWVPSLPQYRFGTVMREYLDSPRADPVKLRHLLGDYLDTYDACRRAGLSRGPAISALRVYRVEVVMKTPPPRFDLTHDFGKFATLAVQIDRAPVPSTRP